MLRGLLFVTVLFVIQANSQADDALPNAVRKEFDSWVGTWVGTVEIAGEKGPVKMTAAWAPGNQCLIIHEEYSVGGQPGKITALMAYDRIKKHVVNIGFRTDGGNRTLTFDEGYAKGKITGDGPNGELSESNFTIDKSGGVEWVIKFKGVSAGAVDFMMRLRKMKS